MYYGNSTETMAKGHVLVYVWLSSLAMQVGGSGAAKVRTGGLGGLAPPQTPPPPAFLDMLVVIGQ